jgi:UDP-hydrolysing UDP-N-acetyl-D-glucosamine 2-epimerase
MKEFQKNHKINPLLEIVVTARPSWARVRSLLFAYRNLAGADKCRLSLVGPAVSKRYGDITTQAPADITVKTFQTLRDSDDLASIALNCIDGSEALARHWGESRPDCVLVIADRTETLGVSSTAALMQIPLIHLQGGETSGSIDDKIRDGNTKLADLHLTTNNRTRDYLISIGEKDELIRVVGCPSLDIVKDVIEKKEFWKIGDIRGVGAVIQPNSEYGIIMFHPDTLDDASNQNWIDTIIKVISESPNMWFWFWPNPDFGTGMISKRLRQARENDLLNRVQFVINASPDTFVNVAIHAGIMIGNSSFGIREGSYIGLPVINLGNRQRSRERGPNVIDLDTPSSQRLAACIIENMGRRKSISNIYGDGSAGVRAAKAISEWRPRIKQKL